MIDLKCTSLQVSVVIPVYRNAETLNELRLRIHRTLLARNLSYEIIFVNDASTDDSLAVLQNMAQIYPHICTLSLSSNVGQHRAVLLGFLHARGELLISLDGDLQDPPESIPILLDTLLSGWDVVFAGRRGFYEQHSRLFTSKLFKTSLHWVAGVPRDAGMFFAIRRAAAVNLTRINFPFPFVVGMIGCSRASTTSIPVERSQRSSGKSTYSSWKRLKTGLMAILSVLIWRLTKLYWQELPTFKYPDIKKFESNFSNPEYNL